MKTCLTSTNFISHVDADDSRGTPTENRLVSDAADWQARHTPIAGLTNFNLRSQLSPRYSTDPLQHQSNTPVPTSLSYDESENRGGAYHLQFYQLRCLLRACSRCSQCARFPNTFHMELVEQNAGII